MDGSAVKVCLLHGTFVTFLIVSKLTKRYQFIQPPSLPPHRYTGTPANARMIRCRWNCETLSQLRILCSSQTQYLRKWRPRRLRRGRRVPRLGTERKMRNRGAWHVQTLSLTVSRPDENTSFSSPHLSVREHPRPLHRRSGQGVECYLDS